MTESVITHQRCEYLVDPLGIDERLPRLSWRLALPVRGARQVAYRIRVASSAENVARGVADRWDSGRIEGDRTTQVPYGGAPLASRDGCFWQVESWVTGESLDPAGVAHRSPVARWTMGLLEVRGTGPPAGLRRTPFSMSAARRSRPPR
jgi:alpha-L-rhamnosidase